MAMSCMAYTKLCHITIEGIERIERIAISTSLYSVLSRVRPISRQTLDKWLFLSFL